jgi:hypothetical protein
MTVVRCTGKDKHVQEKNLKYVAWLADGGTTHMFCNLGACLRYAVKSGRQILPVSVNQATLKDHFYRFFDLQKEAVLARYFVPPEKYCKIFCSYVPPNRNLPTNLFETRIEKERVDLHGRIYYTLEGIESIEGNVRYLDYPIDEFSKYVLTWGGFDRYFTRQLYAVVSTIRLHSSISTDVLFRIRKTSELTRNRKYLSVHFRNTDYTSDIKILFSQIDECLIKHPDANIFWATDDKSSLNTAMLRYGKRIVPGCVPVDVRLYPGVGSLHSLSDKEFANLQGISRASLFADFFHDVYMLSNSLIHFKSAGNVGFLVDTLRSLSREAREKFFGFY